MRNARPSTRPHRPLARPSKPPPSQSLLSCVYRLRSRALPIRLFAQPRRCLPISPRATADPVETGCTTGESPTPPRKRSIPISAFSSAQLPSMSHKRESALQLFDDVRAPHMAPPSPESMTSTERGMGAWLLLCSPRTKLCAGIPSHRASTGKSRAAGCQVRHCAAQKAGVERTDSQRPRPRPCLRPRPCPRPRPWPRQQQGQRQRQGQRPGQRPDQRQRT